jgi:hypothetical protein
MMIQELDLVPYLDDCHCANRLFIKENQCQNNIHIMDHASEFL